MDRLRCTEIVAAPINTLLEASNDPDVLLGDVTEVDYPKYRKRLKVHGSPRHFSETPAQIGTAPDLSAHNDEILAALGYTPAQIEVFGKDRSFNAGEQADPKQARVASANTRGAGWCL